MNVTATHKKVIAGIGLVVVLGAGYSVYKLRSTSNQVELTQQEIQQIAQSQDVPTTFIIDSPNFTSTTTATIAHIVSSDGKLDFYHAICPGTDDTAKKSQTITLPKTSETTELTVDFIPAITDKAGIVAPVQTQVVLGEADTDKQVNIQTTDTEPKDVDPADLEKIVDKTKQAIESGKVDETLTKDNADKQLKQLTENIKASEKLEKEDKKKLDTTIADTKTQKEVSKEVKAPSNVVAVAAPVKSHETTQKKKVWKVDKAAYTEKVKVKDAWDEKVVVKAAWDEDVKVKDAWTEKKEYPPVMGWRYEERVVDIKTGKMFNTVKEWANFDMSREVGGNYTVKQVPVEKVVKYPGYTKTIEHEAVYKTVHHDAQYKTVHHDPVYKTITHPETGHWEFVN